MHDVIQVINDYPVIAAALHIVVVLLLCLLIHAIKNKICNSSLKKERDRNNMWAQAVITAMRWPLTTLIWLSFTIYTLTLISNLFPQEVIVVNINHYLKSMGVITLLAWFIINLINHFEHYYLKAATSDTSLDLASSNLVGKVARSIIIIITAMIILQNLGYSLTALLALGGTGSLVIGFAGKDMISNFFGGLMVYLDKPFKVGDTIKTDTYHLEGIIEKIGWRTTRIRNLDKRPVYVPNNLWVNAPVENISRMSRVRFKEIIGIRYQDADKLKAILADIEQELNKNDDIDHKLNTIVRFHEYGEYSLRFMVSGFSKVTAQKDFMLIKENILLMVMDVVKKHNAEFAIPVAYTENQTD